MFIEKPKTYENFYIVQPAGCAGTLRVNTEHFKPLYLPYLDLADAMHASLDGPDIASHFSAATL